MNMQIVSRVLLMCGVLISALSDVARTESNWVTIFRDDFDGSQLNHDAWRVLSPNGVVELSGGVLRLRSGGRGFPSLATADGVVPSLGNVKLRFGFRYTRTTCYGTRIGAVAFGVGVPACPYDPIVDPVFYGFKRDCAGSTATVMPSGLVSACGYAAIGFSDAHANHVGELVFSDGSLVCAVDGVAIASAYGPVPRPSALFLGWGADGYDYTEYDVEFVEVQSENGLTPSRQGTWGRVKALYR